MVEKTRRSLTVLRRCQEADREELNYWIRRYSDAEDLKKGGSSSSSHSRQQSPVNPDPVALGIFSSDGHTEQIYLMLLILPLFLICLGKNKGATENCRTINTLYPPIRLVCQADWYRKGQSQKLNFFCRLMCWTEEQTSKPDQNFMYITKVCAPS